MSQISASQSGSQSLPEHGASREQDQGSSYGRSQHEQGGLVERAKQQLCHLEHSDINVGAAERAVSAVGGGGLLLSGIGRLLTGHWKSGLTLSAAGVYLAYRGVRGHCAVYSALNAAPPMPGDHPFSRTIAVRESITIRKSPDELFKFWRELTELPKVMRHIEKIERLSDNRSRWTVCGPMDRRIEWEAVVVDEKPGEYIYWVSTDEQHVEHRGSVRFEAAPGDRGTIVRVSLLYRPTGGAAAALFAKLFGREPAQEICEDLQRLKQYLETGEIATNESPSARHSDDGPDGAAEFEREEEFAGERTASHGGRGGGQPSSTFSGGRGESGGMSRGYSGPQMPSVRATTLGSAGAPSGRAAGEAGRHSDAGGRTSGGGRGRGEEERAARRTETEDPVVGRSSSSSEPAGADKRRGGLEP